MRPRTLVLLVCLAAAALLLVSPVVGTAPPGVDGDATTTSPTTQNDTATSGANATARSATTERATAPRTTPTTSGGPGLDVETTSRRTTTEDLGPGPDQPRGSPSAWTNTVRYLLFPGAVLGLFVGLVDGLTRAFPRRWRRHIRALLGLVGVGLVPVAVVGATTWPPSGAIAIGGLGASCAVVAVVDRRGETTTARLGAAAGVAAAVLAVAVGAAFAGATPRGLSPVVVAAPGLGAAALFAVGTVAARRSGWTAGGLSVLVYWAGAVAAGALGVQAQGMGAGLATMALMALGAIAPLAGIPLYALGVTASRRDGADDAASSRR